MSHQDTLRRLVINYLTRNLLNTNSTTTSERGDEAIYDRHDESRDILLDCDFQVNEEPKSQLKRNSSILLSLIHLCCAEEEERINKLVKIAKKSPSRQAKKRRSRNPKFFVDPELKCLRPMIPTMSSWWILYVENPKPECKKWSKKFRSRFRLPYSSFLDLLNMLTLDDTDIILSKWRPTARKSSTTPFPHLHGSWKGCSPLALLLMGSLRYLGRGLTFDDLEECTFISRDVHRVFFHAFIKYGATKLYNMYVKMPESIEELRECEHAYRIAGFPGCIGSCDATHIPLDKVAFSLRQAHLGFKNSVTTRTYNLTVNHKRKILHSTTGHPGRWNDKTLVRFDRCVSQLQRGDFDDKMTFELNTARGSSIKMKGAYVIVDNGYLDWSTTVPPLKDSIKKSEVRFSQWLESLRKDVECTFGILKSRWRILKTGIRLHNTEAADNVWLTCCALHNMLLDVDGLSQGWENGVPSFWTTDRNGDLDVDDIPEAIRRLNNSGGFLDNCRSVDLTAFGSQEWREDDDLNEDEYEPVQVNRGDVVSVTDLPLKQFRSMLIENFDFQYKHSRIVWPKRLVSKPRHVPN